MKRVGTASRKILDSARALATGSATWLADPRIPDSPGYVTFDLEGLPPQLDQLEKVYLWGLQVRGAETGPYAGATAGFGQDGDREGWFAFLGAQRRVYVRHAAADASASGF
jgi:hypothetical protein